MCSMHTIKHTITYSYTQFKGSHLRFSMSLPILHFCQPLRHWEKNNMSALNRFPVSKMVGRKVRYSIMMVKAEVWNFCLPSLAVLHKHCLVMACFLTLSLPMNKEYLFFFHTESCCSLLMSLPLSFFDWDNYAKVYITLCIQHQSTGTKGCSFFWLVDLKHITSGVPARECHHRHQNSGILRNTESFSWRL